MRGAPIVSTVRPASPSASRTKVTSTEGYTSHRRIREKEKSIYRGINTRKPRGSPPSLHNVGTAWAHEIPSNVQHAQVTSHDLMCFDGENDESGLCMYDRSIYVKLCTHLTHGCPSFRAVSSVLQVQGYSCPSDIAKERSDILRGRCNRLRSQRI